MEARDGAGDMPSVVAIPVAGTGTAAVNRSWRWGETLSATGDTVGSCTGTTAVAATGPGAVTFPASVLEL
jgi:hypothetical protein